MGYGEADTRAKLIDPALYGRGWTEAHIKREETAGAIHIIDGQGRRAPKGRTDYTLRIRVNSETQPVAVGILEAKAEDLPPGHGLEQGKCYADAKRLNVPFVFSTNGHLYVEYDRFTGRTSRPASLDVFPHPDELRRRYEAAMGFTLDDPAAKPLLTRYHGGEAGRRYYQDAAIRATFEKMAKCGRTGEPRRALLSLATGAGKTFIAVHLLRRIADAGQLRRALFICDRDELRTQAAGAFGNVFGADAAPVSGANAQKNARVLIATYQTLGVASDDEDASFLLTHYPEDYFSHIIIDECHRSAWGKWSQVLLRNPNAVQVGLTATPRKLVVNESSEAADADAQLTADNVKHFGEPVYEYDMVQGFEDGYLAPCDIVRLDLFHDNNPTNERETGIGRADLADKELSDATTGEVLTAGDVPRDQYAATAFEDKLVMPDRVEAMSKDLFNHLLESGGPEQKTIIFCARDTHAQDVANAMGNLYADWCRANNRKRADRYAFKCTAAVGGADMIADFKGQSRNYFIATTVDLLTTGVDVPAVRNIVFFKYVRSPISFYQMIGRGTRLDAASNKLMFHVYDYTDATRLFGQDFITRQASPRDNTGGPVEPPERTIVVEGIDVRINDAGRYILAMVNGRHQPITVEEYKERLAGRLVDQAPTLDAFRQRWIVPEQRQALLESLPDAGRSAALVRQLDAMEAYDLYDVLGELGYGLSPRTRGERAEAFTYKHAGWLSGLPTPAERTVRAIARQFERGGTEGLESPHLFQTAEVNEAGGLAALRALGNVADVVQDTKERMFAA